jgi:hypothetical protein
MMCLTLFRSARPAAASDGAQGERAWLRLEQNCEVVAAAVRGAPTKIGFRDGDIRARWLLSSIRPFPLLRRQTPALSAQLLLLRAVSRVMKHGLCCAPCSAVAAPPPPFPQASQRAFRCALLPSVFNGELFISASQAACGKDTTVDLGIFGTLYAYLMDPCDIVVGRPTNTDETLAQFDREWERYATYAMECAPRPALLFSCSVCTCDPQL